MIPNHLSTPVSPAIPQTRLPDLFLFFCGNDSVNIPSQAASQKVVTGRNLVAQAECFPEPIFTEPLVRIAVEAVVKNIKINALWHRSVVSVPSRWRELFLVFEGLEAVDHDLPRLENEVSVDGAYLVWRHSLSNFALAQKPSRNTNFVLIGLLDGNNYSLFLGVLQEERTGKLQEVLDVT